MSEASESLHIAHVGPAAVRSVAASLGVAGRIVASNAWWTCFVNLEDEDVDRLALEETIGLALTWRFHEDFGLWVRLREHGSELGGIDLSWEGSEFDGPSSAVVSALHRNELYGSWDAVVALARAVRGGGAAPRDVRDAAASLLKLSAHEWLSPRYNRDTSIERMRQAFPDAEEV